jgi:hypothetical protein
MTEQIAKDDTRKLEQFEKVIIDYAGWTDTGDDDVRFDIEEAAESGHSDFLVLFCDMEEICIDIWDSLHEYLEKTKGTEYIKKIHAWYMDEGEFFRGIVEIAAQITAEHILDGLEDERDD